MWPQWTAAAGSAGLAAALYVATLAPGLTWANEGADGGELLAAAVAGGVPHPPGYPLYTAALGGWLTLLGWLWPGSDLAWRGNLLSAFLAALSVGVTVLAAGSLLAARQGRWGWAALAGLAWASCPLLWSQALITEVYTLHAAAVALLGWALLAKRDRVWLLAPIVALGVANHLTFILLLPAAAYLLWVEALPPRFARRRAALLALAAGILLGGLLYLRIPQAASTTPPPAVNWGYADNWVGFWWLISGQAYRGYLFSLPWAGVLNQVAAWAYTLTRQFTVAGLALALVGLAHLDAHRPRLRTFGLLWVLPISLYAVSYYTRDSDIYLISAAWMMVLWLTLGLVVTADWLRERRHGVLRGIGCSLASIAAATLLLMIALRLPAMSLRGDDDARRFVEETLAVVEPNSIVITSGDHETFALWYAAWADGSLPAAAPDVVLVNAALYQFDWYRRLQSELYPGTPGIGDSVDALLAANPDRPVYAAQDVTLPPDRLQPAGPLLRYE